MCNPGIVRNWRRLMLLFIVVGVGAGSAVRGQSPFNPQKQQAQVARCYVKKTQFNLPLNMSQQTRNELSKIQVYCQNNANGMWVQLAECPPHHTGFNFEAPGEGEYWFTLCQVDKLKRKVPADPSQSEYKMAVVVDTTPPTVDAQYLSTTNEGYLVEVAIRDAHPDPSKTLLEYQLQNREWRAVEPVSPGANRFCIPLQAAITGTVKVCGCDLADNAACREFELPALKSAARQILASMSPNEPSKYISLPAYAAAEAPGNAAAAPATVAVMPAPSTIAVMPAPVPISTTPTGTVRPAGALSSSGAAVGFANLPGGPTQVKVEGILPTTAIIPVEDVSDRVSSPEVAASRPREIVPPASVMTPPQLDVTHAEPISPTPSDQGGIEGRLNPTMAPADPTGDANSTGKSPIVPASASGTPPATGPAAAPAFRTTSTLPDETSSLPVAPGNTQASPTAPRKLINQRRVMLDYRLEHVGASGVGKVEIWITSDMSQSWQKLSEDVERKNPVIELPAEGVYGITMVVTNGRGFGGSPPNPGDVPDTWVEVDMTRPIVEMKEIRAGGSEDPGAVHITWNAHDRNLSPEAVDLYYAASRQGNWIPMAKGLRNDGHYRWTPPASVGSHVYVRMVARDLAGNATIVETSQSFAIDDMSRPRGRLIGIVPVSGEIRHESTSDR